MTLNLTNKANVIITRCPSSQSSRQLSGMQKVLNLCRGIIYLSQLELKMHCLLTFSLDFSLLTWSAVEKPGTTHMFFVSPGTMQRNTSH